MRILFVSQTYLRKELGAAKVLMELSEEMQKLDWECDLVSVPELVPPGTRPLSRDVYTTALKTYLRAQAGSYDVVDYDHLYLPFSRSEFAQTPLFVARAVLLHREVDPVPRRRSVKSTIRSLIYGRRDRQQYREVVRMASVTVREADLVNVANHDDETELLGWGIRPDRIVVLPYGLSPGRQALFDLISPKPPSSSVVAFVGTFDNRKGATDFPALVREVVRGVPDVSFLLLGTCAPQSSVLKQFPADLRNRIKVVPEYKPEALPELLATCSMGVFPSYLESFGFGVLEMLAAALPVVAYNVPGPPMMLPPPLLVARGDVQAMSARVVALLKDAGELGTARLQAQQRARAFSWKEIARKTSNIYLQRSQEQRSKGAKQGVQDSRV